MGQTLSEPETTKETSCLMSDHYKVGSSCMQGWRSHMEDAHCHILSLPEDPGTAFFGVYDGHGGSTFAQHCSKHLHKYILKQPEYKTNVEEAIVKGFMELDNVMLTDETLKSQMAGTTAVTVLVKENKLYCGNCGDSRAIGCKNGRFVILSNDHKPMNPEESIRIYNAGGWIECNRVNGSLALSRALGDYIFKRNEEKSAEEQIVTALPEVMSFDLTEDWNFIVLACDGIWDVLSNQEVVDFVVKNIAEGKYPETICEELLSYCLAPACQMGGLGGDNMTVIIICLLHGQPYENLIEKCQKLHEEREKNRSESEERDHPSAQDRLTITQLNIESLMNDYFAQCGSSCFQTVGKIAKQTVECKTDDDDSSSSSSSTISSPTQFASNSFENISETNDKQLSTENFQEIKTTTEVQQTDVPEQEAKEIVDDLQENSTPHCESSNDNKNVSEN